MEDKAVLTLGPGTWLHRKRYPYRIHSEKFQSSWNMAEIHPITMSARAALPPQQYLMVAKVQRLKGVSSAERIDYDKALRREEFLLQEVNHPAIVQLLPVINLEDHRLDYAGKAKLADGSEPWFIVLEYLEGGSLSKRLDHYRTPQTAGAQLNAWEFDPILALKILRSLASGLEHLHARRIVHLDIKPENILFREPPGSSVWPQPVFIDFGIASKLDQELTEWYTSGYASPERRNQRVNKPLPAMDIWSLGVVFEEMLTGVVPTAANEDRQTRKEKAWQQHKEKYSGAADDMTNLLAGMLDENHITRLNAEQVADRARKLIDRLQPNAYNVSRPEVTPPLAPLSPKRERRWMTPLLLFFVPFLVLANILQAAGLIPPIIASTFPSTPTATLAVAALPTQNAPTATTPATPTTVPSPTPNSATVLTATPIVTPTPTLASIITLTQETKTPSVACVGQRSGESASGELYVTISRYSSTFFTFWGTAKANNFDHNETRYCISEQTPCGQDGDFKPFDLDNSTTPIANGLLAQGNLSETFGKWVTFRLRTVDTTSNYAECFASIGPGN